MISDPGSLDLTGYDSPAPAKLLYGLRGLLQRKPQEHSLPSLLDEFNIKLQEFYMEILARFPQFAVAEKLELEMWNTLYKTLIDSLQSVLQNRATGPVTTAASGQPRSILELKLRFILLLDRASGVYFVLINRLLDSLSDNTWPKSILGASVSLAAPLGFFKFIRLGQTSGRFDLDLATFSALPGFAQRTFGYSRWLANKADTDLSSDTTSAPRILSRGDRLPPKSSEDDVEIHVTHKALTPPGGTPTSIDHPTSDGPMACASLPVSGDTKATITTLDHESAIIYLVQHCLVHLGDVSRYRQQPNVAAGYYLWAWVVHPDSGHPFNQLAILESSKGTKKRLDASMYYYVRAIACQYPFPVARTNLKSLLRTQLSAGLCGEHAENPPGTGSDTRQLLVQFYAALYLCADPCRLVALASKFTALATQSDHLLTSKDIQCLFQLVTVHIYLLTEHSGDTLKIESDGVAECGTVARSQVGRTLLLHTTVYLIELITHQYSLLNYSDGTHSDLLSNLVLLLLWLRLQASSHSASLDTAFRIYAPSLSDHTVYVLNNLLQSHHEPNVRCDQTSTRPHITNSGHVECDTVHAELDWAHLLRLPELAQLQGFRPLHIPTQRHVCTSQPQIPAFPFTMASGFQDLFTRPSSNELNLSASCNSLAHSQELDYCHFTPSGLVAAERVHFILQTARVIAHQLPALLGWIDNSKQELNVSAYSLNGRFRRVTRPVVTLAELITTSSSKSPSPACPNALLPFTKVASNVQANVPVVSSKASDVPLVNPMYAHSTNTTQGVDEISMNSLSKQSVQISDTQIIQANGARVHTEASDVSASMDTEGANLSVKADHTNVSVSLEHDMSMSLSASDKPVSVIDHSVIATIAPSLPASTSGGLIVNAELAKFIQEQASQVAARQQRVEQSPNCINSADPHTCAESGKLLTGDTATDLRNGKSYSSRLCLSTAFRRDLPPRFARRLQAELLEREAAEQRLARATGSELRQQPTTSNSNFSMLSLNQPAPLARKESEAPFELSSLLSATDAIDAIEPSAPMDFTAGQFAHSPRAVNVSVPSTTMLLNSQPSANSFISGPFCPNASLNVSSMRHVPSTLPLFGGRTVPVPLTSCATPILSDSSCALPVGAPKQPLTPALFDWHQRDPAYFKAQTNTDAAPPLPPTQSRYVIPPYNSLPQPQPSPFHAVPSAILNPLLTSPEHHMPSVDNYHYSLNNGISSNSFSPQVTRAQMAMDMSSYIPHSLLMDEPQTNATPALSFVDSDQSFAYTDVP